MKAFDLGGRRALVTGGSRGIGLGIAKGLAEAGADIVLCARGIEELEAAKNQVGSCGVNVRIFSVDMSKTEEIDDFYGGVIKDTGVGEFLAVDLDDHLIDAVAGQVFDELPEVLFETEGRQGPAKRVPGIDLLTHYLTSRRP